MIIGLNGKMGVGKSTAANFIQARSKQPIKLIKFAAPLYDMQEYIYRRISSIYTRNEDFTKDRKLLQWLGTEWGRGTIGESLWIDLWRSEVKTTLSSGYNVICDDVRFNNEAAVIKELGGIVLNISSSLTNNRINTKTGIIDHSSEKSVDSKYVQSYIENNGTEKEFDEKIRVALTKAGIILLEYPK